jgi:hypothetical protein
MVVIKFGPDLEIHEVELYEDGAWWMNVQVGRHILEKLKDMSVNISRLWTFWLLCSQVEPLPSDPSSKHGGSKHGGSKHLASQASEPGSPMIAAIAASKMDVEPSSLSALSSVKVQPYWRQKNLSFSLYMVYKDNQLYRM